MNVLIIGNGFDLAHGLPTRYWDFMMFIKNLKLLENKNKIDMEKEFKYQNLNEHVKTFLLDDNIWIEEKRTDLLREFKILYSDNMWIEYFNDSINYHKGWIDFEYEISEVIKTLENLMNHLKDKDEKLFTKKVKQLLNKLNVKKQGSNFDYTIKQIEDLKDKLINDLNNMIRCLEIYLIEVVSKIDRKIGCDIIKNLKIDKVLSFNYTNTYEKIYNKENVEYDYIHGRIDATRSIENNNMVLGIDEYLKANLKDEKLDFIEFKKYFQRIYKKTGCKYKKWIEEIKEYDAYEHNLYIFGHSLDITDKDVLEELIMIPNVKTTVFYHDKDSHIKYISNMIKIIKQDNLISKVHGSNPSLIFINQNENFVQPKERVTPNIDVITFKY